MDLGTDRNQTVTTFEAAAAPEPEAPAGAGEPIPANVAGDGQAKVCRSCGTVNPIEADACENPRCRKLLALNQHARQHGLYAARQPAELVAEVEAFAGGVVSDQGGAEELSTIERAYVGRLSRLELSLRLLEADIAEHGLVTSAGGVRKVYAQYLLGVDRWDRLAQRLGLRRRARAVNFQERLATALAAKSEREGRTP